LHGTSPLPSSPHQTSGRLAIEPVCQGRIARAEALGMEIILEIFTTLWTAVNRDAGWLVDDKHHPVAIEKPCEQFFVGYGRRPLWLDRASTTSRAI
jgi:hypothetical protein